MSSNSALANASNDETTITKIEEIQKLSKKIKTIMLNLDFYNNGSLEAIINEANTIICQFDTKLIYVKNQLKASDNISETNSVSPSLNTNAITNTITNTNINKNINITNKVSSVTESITLAEVVGINPITSSSKVINKTNDIIIDTTDLQYLSIGSNINDTNDLDALHLILAHINNKPFIYKYNSKYPKCYCGYGTDKNERALFYSVDGSLHFVKDSDNNNIYWKEKFPKE